MSSERIIISAGRVIDPLNDVNDILPVYLADGRVVAVGECPQGFVADQTIDATGYVVCPGFIDLSARLREPGQEYKANIASETAAAARAGITTLCCPPDTHPVIDTPAVVELIIERALDAGKARVLPIGALTHMLKGELLSEMAALKSAGCRAVSNAYYPLANTLVLRRAIEYAVSNDLLIIIRPEDMYLHNGGCVHESAIATRLGLPGIPRTAETTAVAQALALIEQCGARAHFAQLSCARSAVSISRAQYDGVAVSADVAIHQLHLTVDDIEGFNAACHLRPPLRTQNDQNELRKRVENGVVSAICSDHQPHEPEAKLNVFPLTEPGASALETLLPLTLKLVKEGVLTLPQAIARLTCGPAQILRLDSGSLQAGAVADICIFDAEKKWQPNETNWLSQGRNTPFWGYEMQGRVVHTFLGGKRVFSDPDARKP